MKYSNYTDIIFKTSNNDIYKIVGVNKYHDFILVKKITKTTFSKDLCKWSVTTDRYKDNIKKGNFVIISKLINENYEIF